MASLAERNRFRTKLTNTEEDRQAMLSVLASAAEPQKSLPALTNLPLRLVARGPAGVVEVGGG